MDFPPEILCMVKSSLTNQELFTVELTCRYLFWCTVSNKECQLRKCRIWNRSKEKILFAFKHGSYYCSHLCCWKYRCQYLSLEDWKNGIDLAPIGIAAREGHFPVVQYLCETYLLKNEGFFSKKNNYGLRLMLAATENGHLPVVRYLCEKFQLTIQDVRSNDNFALRWAAFHGNLPVVQYLCQTYSLTIEDVRTLNNWALRCATNNGHLPVVQYFCENFQLTIQDVRDAPWRHLSVEKYLRQKYSI
jgi:hypothetical protein